VRPPSMPKSVGRGRERQQSHDLSQMALEKDPLGGGDRIALEELRVPYTGDVQRSDIGLFVATSVYLPDALALEAARRIARIVLRRPSLPPAGDGINEDLKLLSNQRNRLVRARTVELGRIHSFMTVLRPEYQTSLGILKHDKTLSLVIRMLRADASVRAQLVRESVAEVRRLNRAIARVEQRIEGPLASLGTTLHLGLGIGAMAAAKILGEAGDPAQLRSAAGFARMSGVVPIPASSGNTVRHRHDRGGNRVLNHTIHMIALTRCRLDQTTKEFMAKKRAEGKTGREAMRALKRHIANDIYRHMKADSRPRRSSP
jgi:transposase